MAISSILNRIYSEDKAKLALQNISTLIQEFNQTVGNQKEQSKSGYFSEDQVVLITYADSLKRSNERPLETLNRFACQHLKDVFSTIHLLPFFPYSSDDGFSVKDFYAVDPAVGNWDDIQTLTKGFDLMFDFVLNHISAKSQWFNDYLNAKPGFENLAIEVSPTTDLSQVTRPRALPLLTPFQKQSGKTVHVWTTFSDDQIDINYQDIDILIKMIKILLFYVKQGATIIRMDAIAYLWKIIGTSCIHLQPTHDIVKLFRAILDQVAPHVILLTETNVPHAENISYFGQGDEAQMVYNFTLPPLLLYSFISENTTVLSDWAKKLTVPSNNQTFFNFTASHDGIGVRPLEGILPDSAIDEIIQVVLNNGGKVSYKHNPDGSQSPYELNLTYVDAMRPANNDPIEHAKRFLASQSIQLVLPGVPGIYIHSILGSHNWHDGVKQTGRARTINREKLSYDNLENELLDSKGFRSTIFNAYCNMITLRRKQPAFHPNATFIIHSIHPNVFVIQRTCDTQSIVAMTNVSNRSIDLSIHPLTLPKTMRDILSGSEIQTDSIVLGPYDMIWLTE